MSGPPSWDWVYWFAGAVVGGAGLALLIWALFADRSRGRRRCPKCGYEMTGVPGPRCPECGREAQNERRLFRTRRRWRWAALGVLAFTAGAGSAAVPAFISGAWVGWIPTPALNFALGFFDKQAEAEYLKGQAIGWGNLAFTGGGVPPTRWERLLLARHCSQLLHRQMKQGVAPDERARMVTEKEVENEIVPLFFLGADARLAVPLLLDMLRSDQLPLRDCAIHVFAILGPIDGSIASKFTRMIGSDQDPKVREAAARALGALGRSVAPAYGTVARALREDQSPLVRAAAASALAAIGSDRPDTLGLLAKALGDQRVEVRIEVVRAIQTLAWPVAQGSASAIDDDRILNVLKGAMGDNDAEVRLAAVNAVVDLARTATQRGRPSIEPDRVFDALKGGMDGNDARVRLAAAKALSEIRPGPWLIPHLIALLDAGSEEATEWSVERLGEYGEAAASAVPTLVVAAHKSKASVAVAVVTTLARIGDTGVPGLGEMLYHPDPYVRLTAAQELRSTALDTCRVAEELVGALDDPDAWVRKAVLVLVGRCPRLASSVIDKVCAILAADSDQSVRQECIHTLSLIDPGSTKVVNTLAEAMKHDSAVVRVAAALLLRDYGPRAAGATDALRAALDDPLAVVRAAAAEALKAIGSDGPAPPADPAPPD